MSYEGYVRLLCANGHQTVNDCYSDEDSACRCGAAFVWRRDVDQTNDDGHDPPLEIATKAGQETTYKAPEQEPRQ